ncbi:MAG: hypothetical protein ACPF9D_01060 [Owenweeksia sp.]
MRTQDDATYREPMEEIARGIQNIGEAIWGVPVENVKIKEK